MARFTYKEFSPQIDKSCFIAEGAQIIGRARIEKDANVWFNVVIRADVNSISIGENTNIQDLSILHVTEQFPLTIGKNITVGHGAILHACSVGDGCLIGMGAKILDGARIGENSLVAAGSIVPPGKSYPAGSFIMGAPAKVMREMSEQEIAQLKAHCLTYVGYANDFKDGDMVKLIN